MIDEIRGTIEAALEAEGMCCQMCWECASDIAEFLVDELRPGESE